MQYTKPVVIKRSCWVKAVAVKSGLSSACTGSEITIFGSQDATRSEGKAVIAISGGDTARSSATNINTKKGSWQIADEQAQAVMDLGGPFNISRVFLRVSKPLQSLQLEISVDNTSWSPLYQHQCPQRMEQVG